MLTSILTGQGPEVTTEDQRDVAAVLALSDERDWWQRRVLGAERAGYERGQRDGYERGYLAAVAGIKAVNRDAVSSLRQHAVTWDGSRADFGRPRPGDYVPRPAAEPRAVWLAGPAVHRHECTAACREYKPGRYSPSRAAMILAAIPGDGAA